MSLTNRCGRPRDGRPHYGRLKHLNEETKKKITDYQVRAFMAFARSIRPGWRADLLAGALISPLKLIGVRKEVARRNITLCFPEKDKAEREKILAESYESMIWTGVEMLAWQHDPTLIDRMIVEQNGVENIKKAWAEGRGAVLFSAHLGSWELGAAWCSRHFPFHGLVRHSDSPFQKKLIETLRERSGLRTISKDSSMKRVITLLRHNETIGVLADQHWGDEGVPAPFFGQKTSTASGPAAFSVLTKAPMIPMAFTRLEPFKFRLSIGGPITPPAEMEREEAVRCLTIRMNEEYEKMIRANPGQWLWQHRRFREVITD